MEKSERDNIAEDVLFMYKAAKNLEENKDYEAAKEKYQCSAHTLINMIKGIPKREPKLKEYKELAKEILSKAEKCQEKLKQDVKRGLSSYLFGKHVKTLEKDELMAPSLAKRRTTVKPHKSSLSFSTESKYSKPLNGPSASNEKSRRTVKVDPKPDNKPKKITVDRAIVEKLAENIIPSSGSNVMFSDIKGQKEVKKAITDNIILPLMNPELFTGIRQPSKAILLYGPPGNGKTLLAKALAGSVKRTFFSISASSLMSKFMGEGEKMMRGLFKLAEELGPSIIFFDEIDSILSSRGENEHEASRRMKTEFLVQFDGVGSSTNNDVLIVAATNRPFDLDNAVLRRFPKKIYVG